MENISHIITEEHLGLDLIHLKDGRVIGINSECVCLYASDDAIWNGENPIEAFTLCHEEKA